MNKRDVTLTIPMTDAEIGSLINALAVAPANITTPAIPETTPPETITPPTPPAPANIDTDSRGVPWLEAVHAGTKGLTKDGVWKRRKGVPAEECAAAEQKALAAVPAAPENNMTPAQMEALEIAGNAVVGMPAPVMPTMPTAAPSPAAAPVTMPGMDLEVPPILDQRQPPVVNAPPPPVDMTVLTEKFNELSGGGRINQEQITAVYGELNITDPNALQTDETLRGALYAKLCQF